MPPLPPLVRTLAEKKVDEFCKRRVPEHAKEHVRLSYKFRGKSITIFEHRPPRWEGMKDWTSMVIAQMRYDEKTGEWTLYYTDRNDKWHEYWDIEPSKDINKLLEEIDEDPTGIFWG